MNSKLWLLNGFNISCSLGKQSNNVFYGFSSVKCTRDAPKWKFLAEAEQNETLAEYRTRFFKKILPQVGLFFSLLRKLNSQNLLFTLSSCFTKKYIKVNTEHPIRHYTHKAQVSKIIFFGHFWDPLLESGFILFKPGRPQCFCLLTTACRYFSDTQISLRIWEDVCHKYHIVTRF